MPAPGKRWRHVILNTKATWLPGDERGFRNRQHRIHSSGDYRNPPPKGEHSRLHRHSKEIARAEVHIPRHLRSVIGRAILQSLARREHPVLAVAVTKVHLHLLAELPDNIVTVKAIIGSAKRNASRAVTRELPGAIWAESGNYKPVYTRAHQLRAFGYILFDQGPAAWTWSFKDGSDVGQFRRSRSK